MGLLPQRIAASLTTTLGALALLLSALGVYGIVAYMVTQQTREIGIRMALGAARRDVLALVLRRGLRLALPGLAFGIAADLGLARLIGAFTLNVPPGGPVTFLGVPLVLLAVVTFRNAAAGAHRGRRRTERRPAQRFTAPVAARGRKAGA